MKFHEIFPDFYRDNETEWYEFIKKILSPEFDIALEEVKALWNLIDIDSIPEEKLPLLADNLGFEFVEILPATYRKQLANAIDLHKFKGTRLAVKKALQSVVSGEIEVKEWFEYDGEPYKFKIEIASTNRQITPKLRDKLKKLIEEYKNERSWLEEIALSYLAKGFAYWAAGSLGEQTAYTEFQKEFTQVALGTTYWSSGCMGEQTAVGRFEQ